MRSFNEPSTLFEDTTVTLNAQVKYPWIYGYTITIDDKEKVVNYYVHENFETIIVDDCMPGYHYYVECWGVNRIESCVEDLYLQFHFCESLFEWEEISAKQELILTKPCNRLLLRGDLRMNDITVSGAGVKNLVEYMKPFRLECPVDNILYIKSDHGTDEIFQHVKKGVYVAKDYCLHEMDITKVVGVRTSELFAGWQRTQRMQSYLEDQSNN